jgi:deoxyribonuclease-1
MDQANPITIIESGIARCVAEPRGATKRPLLTVVGPVINNSNSKIYHLPNCPDYLKAAERNRVPFKTEAEAQAAGYRKARNCP